MVRRVHKDLRIVYFSGHMLFWRVWASEVYILYLLSCMAVWNTMRNCATKAFIQVLKHTTGYTKSHPFIYLKRSDANEGYANSNSSGCSQI
jgi:hypothetical protein